MSLSEKAVRLFRQRGCVTARTRFLRKVALPVTSSVISEAQVPGKDGFDFIPLPSGDGILRSAEK